MIILQCFKTLLCDISCYNIRAEDNIPNPLLRCQLSGGRMWMYGNLAFGLCLCVQVSIANFYNTNIDTYCFKMYK